MGSDWLMLSGGWETSLTIKTDTRGKVSLVQGGGQCVLRNVPNISSRGYVKAGGWLLLINFF